MGLPCNITAKHIGVLRALDTGKEYKYKPFRCEVNPWRRECYFDGQMTRLANLGIVSRIGTRTIQITEIGKKLLQSNKEVPQYAKRNR